MDSPQNELHDAMIVENAPPCHVSHDACIEPEPPTPVVRTRHRTAANVPESVQFPANIAVPAKAFYGGGFIINQSEFLTEIRSRLNIAIPLVVDTEFQESAIDGLSNEKPYDKKDPPWWGITTQFRGIGQTREQSKIFAHPDMARFGDKVRHPIADERAHILTWLESQGIEADIRREEEIHYPAERGETRLPILVLPFYAHFAVADLYRIFGGEFAEDLVDMTRKKKIVMGRRLTSKVGKDKAAPYGTAMPWVMTLNGLEYRVFIKLVDTAGLHGVAGLAAIAKTVGVELTDKGALDGWKHRMLAAYWEKPEVFDRYATGDLCVYDILLAYAEKLRGLYEWLGLGPYFSVLRCVGLTIGRTTNALYVSSIARRFGATVEDIDKDTRLREFLTGKTFEASAEALSVGLFDDSLFIAKCDGGRCRCANPIQASVQGALCDIDIEGAYAAFMSTQPMLFGIPEIEAPHNKPSLGTFLKKHRRQMVPRCYVLRVSTSRPLKNHQLILMSWFDTSRKQIRKRKPDGEGYEITGEIDLDQGETKIFATEVVNATLTSDLLSFIENLPPRERKDLYDNLQVNSWAIYRKDSRRTVEEWQQLRAEWKGENGNFPYWCSETLGLLAIDHLRTYRNQYPKKQYPAENALAKLLCNTCYGVTVSRYFVASNMVVAANVTAGVRCYMLATEIALQSYQTITDGGVFDFNRVLHPSRQRYDKPPKLPAHLFARYYTLSNRYLRENKDSGRRAPLGGIEIAIDETESGEVRLTRGDQVLIGDEAHKWVNETAREHVAQSFPALSLVADTFNRLVKRTDGVIEYQKTQGVFSFEVKHFVSALTLHGSGNYRLDTVGEADETIVRMRSYEANKDHRAFTLSADGELTWLDTYDNGPPSHEFMRRLSENPQAVELCPPFVKPAILKPGEFAERRVFADSPLMPGNTIYKTGVPRLYSRSQFTFLNSDQYKSWRRAEDWLKRRFGYSFEVFFVNEDHTIDYQAMTRTLDEMIRTGKTQPIRTLDHSGRIMNRVRQSQAPWLLHLPAIEAMKDRIKLRQSTPELDDFDWDQPIDTGAFE